MEWSSNTELSSEGFSFMLYMHVLDIDVPEEHSKAQRYNSMRMSWTVRKWMDDGCCILSRKKRRIQSEEAFM